VVRPIYKRTSYLARVDGEATDNCRKLGSHSLSSQLLPVFWVRASKVNVENEPWKIEPDAALQSLVIRGKKQASKVTVLQAYCASDAYILCEHKKNGRGVKDVRSVAGKAKKEIGVGHYVEHELSSEGELSLLSTFCNMLKYIDSYHSTYTGKNRSTLLLSPERQPQSNNLDAYIHEKGASESTNVCSERHTVCLSENSHFADKRQDLDHNMRK